MVKSTENDKTATQNTKQNVLKTLIFVLIAAVIVWFLITNRQNLIPAPGASLSYESNTGRLEKQITKLTEQIDQLQNQVYELRAETSEKVSRKTIAALNKKIDDNARINTDLLESKAPGASVLNLISRVDSLERNIQEISKFSSQGALVLTAALMVKESADKGLPFVYEAEVLRILAEDSNMENAAAIMSRYAETGMPSKSALIASFNNIYAAEHAPRAENVEDTENPNAGWKEKINAKLSGLISIEYNNGKQTSDIKTVDEVYTLVNNGDLYQAYSLMQTHPDYQTPAYQEWQQSVIERENFDSALQKIQAMTLAVMKAESLKAFTH